MRILSLFLFLSVLSINSYSQFEKYGSFEEFDKLSRKFVRAGHPDSAIAAIEYALTKFPKHDQKATFILDFLYSRTGHDEKALDNWEYGINKRYYFGLDNWRNERFKNNPRFEKLARIDHQIGDSLNSLSHIKYEVVLPVKYSKTTKYPLLIVFHGNGRNMQKAKNAWQSQLLENEFIVVYLQSYIFMNQLNFKWVMDDDKTDNEFKAIFDKIMTEYSVDKSKIVLSGMSAGGSLAIHYGFTQFVPATGLVLNCPVVQDLPSHDMKEFVAKQRKIVIITGENDFGLKEQKKLIIQLDKNQARIKVVDGIGHQFPQNFPSLLDEYCSWVVK